MRISNEQYFINLALLISKRSTCLHTQVGCVLVDSNNHILSTGYNGSPVGAINCCDINECQSDRKIRGENLEHCVAVHAEANAIIQCKNCFEIKACYCNYYPCGHCLKLLMNTSCRKIYYLDPYANLLNESVSFWEESRQGRTIKQLTICGD